jgi:hypothetical protein
MEWLTFALVVGTGALAIFTRLLWVETRNSGDRLLKATQENFHRQRVLDHPPRLEAFQIELPIEGKPTKGRLILTNEGGSVAFPREKEMWIRVLSTDVLPTMQHSDWKMPEKPYRNHFSKTELGRGEHFQWEHLPQMTGLRYK